MRKIREVLALAAAGHTQREISRSLQISHTTVSEYLRRAAAAGISWALPEVDEAALEQQLFPIAPTQDPKRPLPEWAEVHRELKRKGVTLQLLWIESRAERHLQYQIYKAAHPEGYQYTEFVKGYRTWQAGSLEPVLRHEHKAGEKVFVNYAGRTTPITDAETGVIREAQLFVGVLSQKRPGRKACPIGPARMRARTLFPGRASSDGA